MMYREMSTFAPHHNVLDGSKPYSISGLITLLSPANSILANALLDKTDILAEDSISSTFKKVSVTL